MIFRRRRTRIEIEHSSIRVQTISLNSEHSAHGVNGAPPKISTSSADISAGPPLELLNATELSKETRK
jgi:hypothetical protein